MIILDVNVLLALHRAEHPQHQIAIGWFERVAERRAQITVLDETWSAFVRLSTNRRIHPVPTPLADAIGFMWTMRAEPDYVQARPDDRRMEVFERLCREASAAGDLVPDAFLAAAAIALDATVASFDRDFARFEEIRWERPS